MARRVSIGRLMVAIGGVALALTLLREWLGPRNFMGPLGPLATLVLLGLASMLATAGQARRFFAGLSATGAALAIAILIAPATILGATWDVIVGPIALRLESPPSGRRTTPNSGLTLMELIVLWAELGEPPWGWEPSIASLVDPVTHRPGIYSYSNTEIQGWVMIPHVGLAAIGGLVALIRRHRPCPGVGFLEASPSTLPSAVPGDSESP